jgi:hypothetical protein
MKPSRRILLFLLVATLGFAPDALAQQSAPGTELSDDAELARGTALWEAGKYAECAQVFGELVAPNARRPLKARDAIEKARVYQGACYVGAGEPERADDPFRAALRANYQMDPPNALVFPDAVIQRFEKVKRELSEEIRAADEKRLKELQKHAKEHQAVQQAERQRIEALTELATHETVIVKNRPEFALIPFGVGQFQNRDTALGIVFLSSEVLLGGAALTSLLVTESLYAQGNTPNSDKAQVNSRLHDWHTVELVSGWGYVGVTVGGIAEALIAYKPEFREPPRRRQLPKELVAPKPSARLTPSVTPLPSGMTLGIRGEF